ncbi:dimethylhistidine N-methyltransferase [Lewinella marina]|uniref:L-histidine N(Alpha)-methyltransferase n=1 Tax=Neolewinella marina TaxID=438751 RepID=A0A2G0CHI9_9BACT|nr:L-histidine N(alpha)-methyltransferase [Neolewinella marina]NJB86135.1 dimethylhistidine N-methyltransferase [Neolewinella marina]PHK99387.1 L-histidine N(alpha)-methyltransferase [Neolewinella marina]
MTASATTLTPFGQDVLQGLSQPQPTLNSKWFYDERGNALFQQIMRCPEYYLTGAEAEIYRSCAPALLEELDGAPFDLIELGAGDGSKTQLLIEQFLAAGARFAYRPIDLNAAALAEVRDLIGLRWPKLEFQAIQGDYFEALDRLGRSTGSRRRLVLFPGANIGNFHPGEAVRMLERIRGFLAAGDLLLTGFDLKKDPAVILAAYNDPTGHTAAFNLNLLHRINRELEGNFDLDHWRHWETYNPATGAACSYLLPTSAQEVTIRALNQTFTFRAWQAIAVEISQKYSLREIEGMAEAAQFTCLRHLQDARGYFTDSLWRVPTH